MVVYHDQNVDKELFCIDTFRTGPWFTFKGEFAQTMSSVFAESCYIYPLVEQIVQGAYYGDRKGIQADSIGA